MSIRSSLPLVAALALFSLAQAQAPAPVQPPLLLGAAWYPEQWPESRWEDDLKLMQAAGIRMVRVGEFAWSRMEPGEGAYDLDWLDRAVALAAKHGILTVLGTPTAAPPAWLTQKYPETLRTEANGRKEGHGGRLQYSFTSPLYRDSCRRIVAQMAQRFGHNPYVLGWQIDNEYGALSFDDLTRADFHEWLKRRFGTLDNLNAHWTTEYWSQSYTDWSQIPFGAPGQNPGLILEWKHFITDTFKSYQHDQVSVLRAKIDPRQFITSNYMGWYDSFDHYILSQELDLSAWDDYVGRGHLDALGNGIIHDLTRGLKRKNFWVMETQPGFVNWSPVNNALDKGEVRQMAWHAIAHGADTVSYWQWRSALNGQEQYHGVLVGADGTPVPLYDEVAQIGREFATAGPALAGTSPASEVALLHSYDSRWAINAQRHHQQFDPIGLLNAYYRPLRSLAQQMDVISAGAPLDGYKLVVAPALNVLPDAMASRLIDYVSKGGHLVLGPRSGMKDEYNALQTARQPGNLLVPFLGARVEQFYALNEEVPLSGSWGQGKATIWAEQLKANAPGVEVLLTYGPSNGWLDGQPAAVTRKVGQGRITYIAAWMDDKLTQAAADWMLKTSGITPAFGPLPENVEVGRRVGGGKEIFVLVNHGKTPRTVALPRAMRPLLAGGAAVTTVELPARGVEVLQAR
jgi:beta-galactosidase